MTLEFDIHNYVGLPYPALTFKDMDLPNLDKLGRAIIGKDILGRPFFHDCTIDGYRLPNEPLITITGRKNIVETIVVGSDRKGTVKEFISAEDYMIKIEGVALGDKEYPAIDVDSVITLCEKNTSLPIENETLNLLFNVKDIVIKDYGFGNMQGRPYSQSYYITAVSDHDFYAELQNGVELSKLFGG